MQKFVLIALILVIQAYAGFGQEKIIAASNEFKIEGKVKTELTYTLKDLSAFPSQLIKDVEIINHKGELKGSAKGLKGIVLKTIFDKVEFLTDSPKELSEFYFIFIATDGYKVVFSWNELFNTEVGNTVFLITEKDGKKINEMEERILVISTSDLKVGRRYIKGLSKIIVSKV